MLFAAQADVAGRMQCPAGPWQGAQIGTAQHRMLAADTAGT